MDATAERTAIARLYDAALGEGSWTHALEAIGRSVGAPTVVLFSEGVGTPSHRLIGGVGVSPDALQACPYSADPDVRMQDGAGLRPPDIVRVHDANPRAASSPARADDDRVRTDETRHSLAITADGGPLHAVHLSAFRPRHREAFGASERETFAAIQPHLRQAIRMAARLEVTHGLQAALHALGEQLGRGVALLDAGGYVMFANALLDRFCNDNDGLARERGVLTTARASAPAFSRLVSDVLAGASGGSIDVIRPSGRPSYSLLVSPVPRTPSALGAATPRVAIIVGDPALSHGPSELALQQRYGLTRAESRMVTCLMTGATVSGAAAQLGISLNTARTHLKHAMAKTGVSRQADLVRLLLTQ